MGLVLFLLALVVVSCRAPTNDEETAISDAGSQQPLVDDQQSAENRRRLREAAALVPRKLVGSTNIVSGKPDLEYTGLKRAVYNTQLSAHAKEIHTILREIVASGDPLSVMSDLKWYEDVNVEENGARARAIELAGLLRRITQYLTLEADRRIRAGHSDAATDSLQLLLQLTQKCSAEPMAIFRLNAMARLLAGEDYSPVLDRLTESQRQTLYKVLVEFDEDDPQGLRTLEFENANASIVVFERAIKEPNGLNMLASRRRESLGSVMYDGHREPGVDFFSKSIYVLYPNANSASAIERSSTEEIAAAIERAKFLLPILEAAESDADLEPVIDEMIVDDTHVLRVILGSLPAIITGTWRTRDVYADLRENLRAN